MDLVTILLIIIAVLSVALIIAIIGLIVQHKKLQKTSRELHYYNISTRWSNK